MVRPNEPLVVEIDNEQNHNLQFQPLDRRIRGRFSFVRTKIPDALRLMAEWGQDMIPGQRIRLDADAQTATLLEPLHDPEHTLLRERIAKRGYRLEPPEQNFRDIHVPTWLFWLKRAVDSGLARIISGEFPRDMGKPNLPRAYRLSEASGDLVTENRQLRQQMTELREQVAELRGMMTKRV